MADAKTGYIGFASYPDTTMKSSSCIYCASDTEMGEVVIIPLTIGCFYNMYQMVSYFVAHGSRIRIVPLSIQYDYISDIYNIVTTFKRVLGASIDFDIKWVFPDIPEDYYSEEFETSQVKSDAYLNEADNGLSFELIESGIPKLYDLKVVTPDGVTKYFSLYYTDEKYDALTADDLINEIHICGNESRHGGLCAIDLAESNKLTSKVKVFNVANKSSLAYFRKLGLLGYDAERWVSVL